MTFLKQVQYTIVGFLAVGVIGLLVLILGNLPDNWADLTKFDFTEDKLNITRTILLVWEFFWLTAIIIGAIYLARRATNKANLDAEKRLEEFEVTFFKVMVAILALAAFFTLVLPAFVGDGLPQYRTNESGQEVNVIAQQYAFAIDDNTLQTGVKYVFKLTSLDTTHGFGLYDPEGILILQAQIVPEYTTNLVHEFDEAGVYTVRCMEYCGVVHHSMIATIIVS